MYTVEKVSLTVKCIGLTGAAAKQTLYWHFNIRAFVQWLATLAVTRRTLMLQT